MTLKVKVAFGAGSNLAAIIRTEEMYWETFAGLLVTDVPETEDKASRGWFIPASFEPEYRDSENFKFRYALTLDYDHITPEDIETIRAAYARHDYVLYTTWSHTKEKPRLRVVLPLLRPATLEEFCAVSRWVANQAGIELAARESHIPAQMTFLPTTKPGAKFTAKINEGTPIDVDGILDFEYANWTDHSSWPHRAEGDGVHNTAEGVTPPDQKLGIVGDFCRAFGIRDTIQRFGLPYVPTETEDRYTYTAGSRPEGAIIYDGDRKLHSHHDTDPARGQNNAFDLVRLHRFAGLDAGVQPGVGPTERPSFRAMVQFAQEQPEVRAAIAEGELSELGPDTGETAPVTRNVDDSLNAELARGSVDAGVDGCFKIIPPSQYADAQPIKWLIKKFWPERGVVFVYGPSGAGKSFNLIDIANSIERGVDWRGRKTRKGRCITIVAEGAYGPRQRAYKEHHGCALDELFCIISHAPNLADPKDVAKIAKAVQAVGGAAVVAIDTLAASFVGNENAGEDMGLVMRHLRWLERTLECCVVVVHHTGKDEDKGMRGYSGMFANADTVIFIKETHPGYGLMEVMKMRDGEKGEKFGYRLYSQQIGIDEDGEPETSCVALPYELPQEAEAKALSTPKGKWQVVLWEAYKQLGMGRTVTRDELFTKAKEMMPPPLVGKDDRRDETLNQAMPGLLIRHLHKHANGYSSSRAVEGQLDE